MRAILSVKRILLALGFEWRIARSLRFMAFLSCHKP
jgi:hypothetical protein